MATTQKHAELTRRLDEIDKLTRRIGIAAGLSMPIDELAKRLKIEANAVWLLAGAMKGDRA